MILRFREELEASGVFEARRQCQNVDWFRSLLQQVVIKRFTAEHDGTIRGIEAAVAKGELPVSTALDRLLD